MVLEEFRDVRDSRSSPGGGSTVNRRNSHFGSSASVVAFTPHVTWRIMMFAQYWGPKLHDICERGLYIRAPLVGRLFFESNWMLMGGSELRVRHTCGKMDVALCEAGAAGAPSAINAIFIASRDSASCQRYSADEDGAMPRTISVSLMERKFLMIARVISTLSSPQVLPRILSTARRTIASEFWSCS